MSLEGKCCLEIDNSECLRGFNVKNSCYVLFVRNPFALLRPPSLPPSLQSLVIPVIQVMVYCFLNNLNFNFEKSHFVILLFLYPAIVIDVQCVEK